ncbi:hypothetical protein CIW49_30400 [Mycolicibacterium sp. P1-18]|nr:hypothetical protein CIW49_30400 [Mycolicibacterium sp. P1-18]
MSESDFGDFEFERKFYVREMRAVADRAPIRRRPRHQRVVIVNSAPGCELKVTTTVPRPVSNVVLA